MRVLLLNPPGRRIYVRDYFCSKTSKSNYLFHPIDLVMLSGTIASEHETAVLDCMAERLSVSAAHARIEAEGPEVVISLVGAVSWEEDRAFLSALAARGRRVLAIGDLLQEEPARVLAREPWIEAALHDFASSDVLTHLAAGGAETPTMTTRGPDGRPGPSRAGAKPRGEYRVPRPRHELFPERGYRFSFARAPRFATVLTDHGCPYPCTFCVIGTLGFRTRPVTDVLEELDHLRARGVRELFVLDQTFGLARERSLELCRAFARRGDLSWTTFSRPDVADDELLSAMRRAGCHTLILGAESADEGILRAHKKGYDLAEVRAGFRRAKRHGMRTVGTFVLGLPEETEESLARTLAFALELELDYLSLNVAVPRFGTPFRARALELGLCERDELVMDQSGAEAFLPTAHLDRGAILAMKRRMVRRFYLRPGYLWRRARAAASPWELAAQAREGLALLRRNV